MDEKTRLLQEVKEAEKLARLQAGLPHLYGWRWYGWARSYYESRNKINLLVAANQISKSSTNIRKCIEWATNTRLWPELWATVPRQFWYLYPSKDVATVEFDTKWVTEFLPRGEFKDHPIYGWREERVAKKIHAIYFNSGVTIYFKSYGQDVHLLQTGTVAAMFCDEELPVDLWDELHFRLSATDGYFHMVFTATRGQEFWKEAMEDVGLPTERFKGAWKACISMYDCLNYDDGTQSPWTLARIEAKKAACKNEREILKRIYGRFVKDDSLKYEAFERNKNVVIRDNYDVPKDWHIYSGVDVGSGGKTGHPSAIVFLAVRPDYRKARVFRGWRGDGIDTTAGDTLNRYRDLKGNLQLVQQVYDHAAKDFKTIADREGETFYPAEKGHEIGESILNTLFRHQMLEIDGNDPELAKLIYELSSLSKDQGKRHAKDDFVDALRYCCAKIPWDWKGIRPDKAAAPVKEKTEIDFRRELMMGGTLGKPNDIIEEEFSEWNELYNN